MRGFRLSGLTGALAAISAGLVMLEPEPIPGRSAPLPKRRRRYTTSHGQHGQRERNRRMRQIATGSLRHENGLDASVPAFGMTIRQYRQQESDARDAAFQAWEG